MIPAEEPEICVGVVSDRKINFELYGDFRVFGSKEIFSGIFAAEIINNVIVCKSTTKNLEVTNEIIFEPTEPVSESFLIRDVVIGKSFHWERKEKQRFNYSLKLLRDKENIIAINCIPLESYLVSVISSEMNAKSSLELLKAHAVIARSWVLAQVSGLEKKKKKLVVSNENDVEQIKWYDKADHKLFDVCADDHCQRFQGVTKVTTQAVYDAVSLTRGIVLLSGNEICDTRYSKCCGGITETYENVWEPVEISYLQSVIDYKYEPENYTLDFTDEQKARKWIMGYPNSYCNTSDKKILTQILVDYDRETTDFYRWRIEYSQEEIANLIKKKTGVNFGQIIDLIPVERGKSSRITKLKIIGTKKTLTIGKELEIRRALSESHLYSSAIVIEKEGGEKDIPEIFILHGAGWGHGVGLCQIGAAVMAAKGHLFDEILLHYFAGVKISKTYS
jgi:SpoIID/LytB domain protein